MAKLIAAAIKLAMDAQYTDAEISKLLYEAATAVRNGKFWSWSQSA
jgi:hypothetical protein